MRISSEKISYNTPTMNDKFRIFLVTDKAPSEATFRGTEFLSYDLGQTGGEPIVSAQDAISLYFRTRQPNGLLFYTGECFYISIFNTYKYNNKLYKTVYF